MKTDSEYSLLLCAEHSFGANFFKLWINNTNAPIAPFG